MRYNLINQFKRTLTASAMVAVASTAMAGSYTDDVIRIGIMNDQSGPYADNCGPGSVVAAKLAVEDAGGEINGKKIEIVVADDQNKPDIGLSTAMRWIERDGVDTIVSCSTSSIAAAVHEMMAEKQKPYMLAGTASAFFTNEKCTPMTTQWLQDSYAMPKAVVNSLMDIGLDTWFFITVDYTFGKAWQDDGTNFIEARGGKVVGSVLHPLKTSDFSSQLLQAQASGAKVIAIANSGADFANTMKQAQEFGLSGGDQKLVPLGLFINAVNGIGLDNLADVTLTTPFYWDLDDETRAFTERYKANFDGRYPNEPQSATYSAVNHYLKAVAAADTDEGPAVTAKMQEIPVNDFQMKDVSIRSDGQVMRPLYLARIKSKDESKGEYDFYEIVSTIDPMQAWRAVEDSSCPLLKSN
ncbi:ABC transporter substrate-binding protein [Hoeflea sp.]|uniref:ABC transporter substrate-binding protein n=1 Tax=Hoeflea sp. TaxID=1940281 RepID=UPI003A8FD974